MAIRVNVPRDLSRVKEKVAFNLTRRQLICFTLAGMIGLPTFFLIKGFTGNVSAATFIMMAVMMPMFFMAMYERNGEAIERIIQHSIDWKRQKKKPDEDKYPWQMFKNGICRADDNFYSKTMRFSDINYKLATDEDQQAIFDNWKKFLNFFDSSVRFELTFVNVTKDEAKFYETIRIKERDDGFDDVRAEYSEMLNRQLDKGNNGLEKTKYITFGIRAKSFKEARPRLRSIENDVFNNFKKMDVKAKPLSGKERLELIRLINRLGGDTNDKLKYPTRNTIRTKTRYATVSAFSYDAPTMEDRFLMDLLNSDASQVISIHLQSINQNDAIKKVKKTITNIDSTKIDEQKKAVRSGYDMDLIPGDLVTYGKDANSFLQDLQDQNERMFRMTFLIMNTAGSKIELKNNYLQTSSTAQQFNCDTYKLDYRQEQALYSILPLASDLIHIDRSLTTSSVGIFIPFTTQELMQTDDEALYYGLNALSQNIIMGDRKSLSNPNGMILGKPGYGKSFAAKREMSNVILSTDDDIIICDPEHEYSALVKKFRGQVIHVSQKSKQYINPMDINENYSDGDNPVSLKAEFILSLFELVMDGKGGLGPVEKTVIDRCIHKIYEKYFDNPVPENMPILADLYNALMLQEEKEAHEVATALEIYVTGSLNVFNNRTNVDINNRIVCYDIKDLGNQLKKIGMLIVQDQVWCRVTANRSVGKATRYYMDEFHLLLQDKQTASYSAEIYKRFRKWGGIPTAITQNVKDLLKSPEVENIFENSEFIYMLKQAPKDKEILAQRLGISKYQISYVEKAETGEGLLIFGNLILPFKDQFPNDLELYKIMTTKPKEVAVWQKGV
jgi:type IV secretory pathway VirB4 component